MATSNEESMTTLVCIDLSHIHQTFIICTFFTRCGIRPIYCLVIWTALEPVRSLSRSSVIQDDHAQHNTSHTQSRLYRLLLLLISPHVKTYTQYVKACQWHVGWAVSVCAVSMWKVYRSILLKSFPAKLRHRHLLYLYSAPTHVWLLFYCRCSFLLHVNRLVQPEQHSR